jgi:hypothetical protein
VKNYYLNSTDFYILFLQPIIGADDVIGVYMEILRENGTIDTIGDISSIPLRLKLIKPKEYVNANHHVWEYQWKNIYSTGESGSFSDLYITIHKGPILDSRPYDPADPDNQEGISYLQIMGLDQGDDRGLPPPDGEIDRRLYLDETGLLFFPTRHPFDSRFSFVTDADSDSVYLIDSVPEIYIDPREYALPMASNYYIKISRRQWLE